jgi:adenylosuccinate lyase
VEEYFSSTQKGSSAMPHKRNPILCERISGLARLLRANAIAAMEDIVLWHERDISHSSVERVVLPDSTILLDYMLNKFTDLVMKLEVHEDRMLENLEKSKGVIFSQRVLLELIDKSLTRDEAYDKVQKMAFSAKEKGIDFKSALLEDDEVTSIFTAEEIKKMFDMKYHLKHVDRIFRKVGI